MSRVESVLLRENTKVRCFYIVLTYGADLPYDTIRQPRRVKKAKRHLEMSIFAFLLDATCYQ